MAQTTLRRELIGAFAVVFAGALLVAVTGVLLLLPSFQTPLRAVIYMAILLTADIAVFALFGRWLIRSRVLGPLDRIVEGAEAIAEGDYGRQLPPGDTKEVDRLSESLNRMAGRLIEHQWELQRNIESLERTNRELTEARDELIRAEKMASLGQMAAGVAHEIGNPLAAIMGNLDLLKRRTEDQTYGLVDAAAEQSKRIDRIVRGLLDYARARQAHVRPIDVNEVVAKAVELVTTQRKFDGVEVSVTTDPGIPAVRADPFQLEQVLVNLMLNAADAMEPDGGAVRITTARAEEEGTTPLPIRRKDDPPGIDYSHRRRFNRPDRIPRLQPFDPGQPLVEIRVADTGPGIPDALMERIFEPFMTTKEPGKGTGLGLAVSARLIDGMDGTIRADNTEEGAEFTIQLPVTHEPAEALTP
ncbi:MAG: ATP-binding protein [Longimicrobiales bacterium]|nr:ATP-binding protein [Longimicrobiales bacterium]